MLEGKCLLRTLSGSVIYCTERFSSRDSLMREHWGAGVGHVYTHHDSTSPLLSQQFPDIEGIEDNTVAPTVPAADLHDPDDNGEDVDNPEYAVGDQENELYEHSEDTDFDIDEYEFD
jgi:hypothetical protein